MAIAGRLGEMGAQVAASAAAITALVTEARELSEDMIRTTARCDALDRRIGQLERPGGGDSSRSLIRLIREHGQILLIAAALLLALRGDLAGALRLLGGVPAEPTPPPIERLEGPPRPADPDIFRPAAPPDR